MWDISKSQPQDSCCLGAVATAVRLGPNLGVSSLGSITQTAGPVAVCSHPGPITLFGVMSSISLSLLGTVNSCLSRDPQK